MYVGLNLKEIFVLFQAFPTSFLRTTPLTNTPYFITVVIHTWAYEYKNTSLTIQQQPTAIRHFYDRYTKCSKYQLSLIDPRDKIVL